MVSGGGSPCTARVDELLEVPAGFVRASPAKGFRCSSDVLIEAPDTAVSRRRCARLHRYTSATTRTIGRRRRDAVGWMRCAREVAYASLRMPHNGAEVEMTPETAAINAQASESRIRAYCGWTNTFTPSMANRPLAPRAVWRPTSTVHARSQVSVPPETAKPMASTHKPSGDGSRYRSDSPMSTHAKPQATNSAVKATNR